MPITNVSSDGFGEPALLQSLTRAFAVLMSEVQKQRNCVSVPRGISDIQCC